MIMVLFPVDPTVPMNSHANIALYFAAVMVIITAVSRLILMELVQCVIAHCRYFWKIENYIEVLAYISSIIFVIHFGTNCWCPTNLQWQLGAIGVFLAWINLILFLKRVPLHAISSTAGWCYSACECLPLSECRPLLYQDHGDGHWGAWIWQDVWPQQWQQYIAWRSPSQKWPTSSGSSSSLSCPSWWRTCWWGKGKYCKQYLSSFKMSNSIMQEFIHLQVILQ